MSEQDLLTNPVWHALNADHSHFALCAPGACRYLADVSPFAGIAADNIDCLQDLRTLLLPGETIHVIADELPSVRGLLNEEQIPMLQMIGPTRLLQGGDMPLIRLTGADAADMMTLIAIAFPGFFRVRTCEMGAYYGVRIEGELVAMGGERMVLPGYREISGVCTHPAHRGKGYAVAIISQLMRDHAAAGLRSFLHVKSSSTRAIELYYILGFQQTRAPILNRLLRVL